jgi:hypothetical protein
MDAVWRNVLDDLVFRNALAGGFGVFHHVSPAGV